MPELHVDRLLAARADLLAPLRIRASHPPSSSQETWVGYAEADVARRKSVAFRSVYGDEERRKAETDHKTAVELLETIRGAEAGYEDAVDALRSEIDRAGPAEWHRVIEAQREEGTYAVVLGPRRGNLPAFERRELLRDMLVVHCGVTEEVAVETLKRVEFVAPETLVSGVSLDDAIEIKKDIESCGAVAKIKEGIRPKAGKREPIPENVRREVWRRDGGRCVDCGSRERLEFDHIVPISRGGSNTARNIELRCESCNRRKGAAL